MSEDNNKLKEFLKHPKKKQMLMVSGIFCLIFLGVMLCVTAFVEPASAKKSKGSEAEVSVTPAEESSAEEPTKVPENVTEAPKSNIPKKTSENNKASLDVTLVPGYVFPDEYVGTDKKREDAETTPADQKTVTPAPTKETKATATPVPTKTVKPNSPTPAPTKKPTDTPKVTPKATPKATPEPTSTSVPEPTKVPEVTAEPTKAPEPTAVPTEEPTKVPENPDDNKPEQPENTPVPTDNGDDTQGQDDKQ